VRVLATLRRFLREGTPWRSLHASAEQVSGSTLRRFLARWAETGVLAKVHALLVAMLRGNPTLILDSCSVRAKRGGELTGPNPTDRAKMGTKYHLAVDGDGTPVACAVTAANVNETRLFQRLLLAATGVMKRIQDVFADKGYDNERHRAACRAIGAGVHSQARTAARFGAGPIPLAGRAHARLVAGKQAARTALRSMCIHHPLTAPGRMHIPGCGNPRQRIVKTAS
jgi:transposase